MGDRSERAGGLMGARLRVFVAGVATLGALAAFPCGCTDKKRSAAPPEAGTAGQGAGEAGAGIGGAAATDVGGPNSAGTSAGAGQAAAAGDAAGNGGGSAGSSGGASAASGGHTGSGGYDFGSGGAAVGTGGFVGSGGVDVGTGGFLGSGGVVGSGGFIGTGGFVGSGGFIGTGGFEFGTGGFVGSGGFDGSGGNVGSGGLLGSASTSAAPRGLTSSSGGVAGFVLCPAVLGGSTPATPDALRTAVLGKWLSCLYTFRGGEDGDALGTQGDGIEIRSDGRYWHLTRDSAGQLTGVPGVDSEGDVSYGLSPAGAAQMTFRSDLNQVLVATPVLTTGPTILIIKTANAEHRYIPAGIP